MSATNAMNATAIEVDLIRDRFDQGIAAVRGDWALVPGTRRKLDLVNHVLRVILQLGCLDEFVSDFEALAANQHEDGGWGDLSDESYSGVRNTCFAARNLIRANRQLRRPELARKIETSVRFVMAQQGEDGSWPDRRWGSRDATSSSMGLLLYTIREPFGEKTEEIHGEARERLARAAESLVRTQAEDGSWPDGQAKEPPVGTTSHLLPKMALFAGQATPAVIGSVRRAIDFVLQEQEEDGSWDARHVDHTCDATRALLLTHSVVQEDRLRPAIEAGTAWLFANANRDGLWGTRPGNRTSLIMTCDVLDCFSKYEAYCKAQDLRAFWQ
jgi:prenyltransferase beta subunit